MHWNIKKGRWRSRSYLSWVCSQPCIVSGLQDDTVQAAHMRYPGCGMGKKPDDFLVYPLSFDAHLRFHTSGQPSVDVQLTWVKHTIIRAMSRGVFVGKWPMEFAGFNLQKTVDSWRELWLIGDVTMEDGQ